MPAAAALCDHRTAPPHSVRRFIVAGYRPLTTRWPALLRSLFYLHNEWGNIHTHLAAFLAFLGLGVRHFRQLDGGATGLDALVDLLFFAGVLLCFGLSTLFHLQCCNTKDAYDYFHACDYAGVVACILGSFYLSIWLGFRCNALCRCFYMTLITVQCAALLCVILTPRWRANRRLLIMMYVAVVASAVLPTVHWWTTESQPANIPLLWAVVATLACYLLGVVIYVGRLPERFAPGRFDYFFHSHQTWHVLVFLAALAEYVGTRWAVAAATRCV